MKPLSKPSGDRWSARRFIGLGLFFVVLLAGGIGGWAATAEISGAVIAPGQLRVQSNKQVVQHPDGGVVGEILVREGTAVEAGDVLIRLDDTLLRAELAALESQLFEIMARRGRLEAEVTKASQITFDPELVARSKDTPDLKTLMEGQRALFRARLESLEKQDEILGERIAQFNEQIIGTEAQLEALAEQAALITQEVGSKQTLLDRGLIQQSDVLALRREAARLKGLSGELRARIGQFKGQITEAEIERTRLETSRLEEAISESRELGFRELEQKERRISFLERLARLDIRAPRSGTVIDLSVHALKSVIRPADPILYIVPSDADLVVDARVQPTDIDQLHLGQDAVLRFSALNKRTTPEIEGEITTISADVITDEKTGIGYYRIEVRLKPGEVDKIEGQPLVAGMPVETYIQTGQQTPLVYLVKPITDYFNRAMREG